MHAGVDTQSKGDAKELNEVAVSLSPTVHLTLAFLPDGPCSSETLSWVRFCFSLPSDMFFM